MDGLLKIAKLVLADPCRVQFGSQPFFFILSGHRRPALLVNQLTELFRTRELMLVRIRRAKGR